MTPASRRDVLGAFAAMFAAAFGWGRLGARGLGLGAGSSWPRGSNLEPQASQGLGQFAGGAPPCKPDEKPTPAAPQGRDYRAKSPERTSLVERGGSGTRLVLTGTVSGLTCGPIKRGLVDFWHADPNGAYDTTGFKFRGRQFTDDNGRYRLETLIPGSSAGRAPRIHVRVEVKDQRPFTTQLFFPDDPRNKSDAAFRPELVVKTIDGRDGKSGVFDIVLNI